MEEQCCSVDAEEGQLKALAWASSQIIDGRAMGIVKRSVIS